MKVFKVLSTIMQIAAAVMFAASIVFCGILQDTGEVAFMNAVLAHTGLLLCALTGTFLTFSNNETAKKVGCGMSLAAFVTGFVLALVYMENSAGAVVMLISVVLLAVHFAFKLVILIMNKGSVEIVDPNEDIRIIRIKEWKQILEAGIITEEEFEEKREQILGIKNKDKKAGQEK